jgi:hypothetical protein
MLMLFQKPQLLHYPWSHEIDACLATKNQHWGRYMPKYFLKQTVLDTWNYTIESYLHLGTFTQDPKDSVLYIPNPDPAMCQGVSRRKKKRIRNNMDEAEAGPQGQICSNATLLDTPTRNAPKHLTFPLPLLHHLHLVHVDVVPAATTKECSDSTCLCYRVVIIELLWLVVVL